MICRFVKSKLYYSLMPFLSIIVCCIIVYIIVCLYYTVCCIVVCLFVVSYYCEHVSGYVVIPYVEAVSERVDRVLKKYGVATAMSLHTTVRRLFLGPKERRTERTG